MITVTKINDAEIIVNSELIEMVEASPDTAITLTTGRRIIVKESVEEIVAKSVTYKHEIYKNLYKKADPV